jgi:hypothetical protein
VWLVVGELLLKLTVVSLFSGRAFSDFPRDRIFVSEDKMQLIISATLVWAKHDSERCFIIKVDEIVVRLSEQLHVTATAFNSVLEGDFVLGNKVGVKAEWLVEIVGKSMVSCFLFDNESLKSLLD